MNKFYWFQSLKRGWQSVGHVWMPMAGYLLVIWLVSLGLLSPLASWALSQLNAGKGELIVGNTDLVGWLLSPRGLLFLTLSGSFALLSLVIQVAGLIWIAKQSETAGIQNVKQTLVQLYHALAALFRFCLNAFLLCLLLLLPLVAGLGVIYYFFLSAHDINFYLTARLALGTVPRGVVDADMGLHSLDGTVVVVHDQDLMKLARDPRRISQTTYQDLSQVDIGSLFHPDFKRERVAGLSGRADRAGDQQAYE